MKKGFHAVPPENAVSPESSRPAAGSMGAWVLAARPPTLTAAVVPVAVGAACSQVAGGLRWDATLAALLSAVWIQIGTNFANDVFDFEQGADTSERLGPTRAVQAGLLTPAQMRRGMGIAFGLAFLFGLWLMWIAGWPMLAIGVASIAAGIAYTGGPFPLGLQRPRRRFRHGFLRLRGGLRHCLRQSPHRHRAGLVGIGASRRDRHRDPRGQQRPRPRARRRPPARGRSPSASVGRRASSNTRS